MPTKLKNKLPPLSLNNKTIGQRLAKFRKQKGYTQKELAKKIGILHTLVSDYERGRIRLYDEMVTRFAIALEVSTDIILGIKTNNHANIKPTLKIIKRLNKIATLPQSEQKFILKTIDSLLKATRQ